MSISIKSWKYIFCIPLLVTLGVVTFFTPVVIENYALTTARDVGKRNLDQILAIRNFYANAILAKVLNQGIVTSTTHLEEPDTVPAPATFAHDISDVITETGTSVTLYSPFPWPNRAERVLDQRQQNVWEYLAANPEALYSQFLRDDAGHRIVYVAYADKLNSETCVNCHNNHPDTPITGWSIGDTRGVLEVTVDVESLIADGEQIGYLFAIFIAILTLITLFLGVSIDRGVSSPIINLSNAAHGIAKGKKIPISETYTKRKDELGTLARSISEVTRYLDDRQRLLELEEKSEASKTTRMHKIEELMAGFDSKINRTFDFISQSIKKIYDSTSYLSTNAEQTSSQITLISSATDEMAQNIQSVSHSGANLSSSLSNVLTQVTESHNISQSANSQANDANTKIQGLADAAQRIGEVVSLINDIANQTNLLALNATIEAARAGESGKGFAVVANEVKNLANQTARATDEISSQIQNIQAETQHAVGAIAQVTEVVTSINKLTGDIADSINSQTQAVHEISDNAQQTTAGTTEVTQGLVSVSTAATSTGTMASELFADAENLRKLAEELGTEIKKFHAGVIEVQEES